MSQVFPVHTGVFLQLIRTERLYGSIPRAYVGVSVGKVACSEVGKYSPCIRGCFRYCTAMVQGRRVFPVHTGVFLYRR